eukprot:scaffold3383_cov129-Skeletonema_dohrnii-CCMP3373.AAC.4
MSPLALECYEVWTDRSMERSSGVAHGPTEVSTWSNYLGGAHHHSSLFSRDSFFAKICDRYQTSTGPFA